MLFSRVNCGLRKRVVPFPMFGMLLTCVSLLVLFHSVGDAALSSEATQRSKRPSYTKPPNANKVMKGKVVPYRLWFDDQKWQQRKPTIESHEYYFEHVEKDTYVSTVYDQVQLPVKTMRDTVIANARTGGMKDLQIIEEEKRIVNGKEVLHLLIEGNFKSVPMVFSYYLSSGKSGTVQLSAFTLKRLFARHRADIAAFMNGLELYE